MYSWISVKEHIRNAQSVLRCNAPPALAFVFVNVDPADFQSRALTLPVLFSENGSRIQHFLLRFFKWNLHIRIRNEGCVKIRTYEAHPSSSAFCADAYNGAGLPTSS